MRIFIIQEFPGQILLLQRFIQSDANKFVFGVQYGARGH